MRLRPLLPALALLALPVLAGCGSSSEDASPAAASPSASASQDFDTLVQAAAAKSTATSSKIVLTSRTQLDGQDISFVGEGAYDYAAKRGRFTFELPGGAGKIEQRIIDENLYLALPQQPGVFFKLTLADLVGTSLGNTVDPSASLEVLDVLEGVKETGTEQVRGVEATVYQGTLDPKKALEKAQGAARTVVQNGLAKLPVDSVPITVYLDDQGRVIKLDQVVELPSGLKSTTTVEVFDFGTTVTVAEPPAAAVKDGGPLVEALKAAPGVGGSGAAPGSPAAPGAAVSPGAQAPAPKAPAATPAS